MDHMGVMFGSLGLLYEAARVVCGLQGLTVRKLYEPNTTEVRRSGLAMVAGIAAVVCSFVAREYDEGLTLRLLKQCESNQDGVTPAPVRCREHGNYALAAIEVSESKFV
jgi:hypothetical protein